MFTYFYHQEVGTIYTHHQKTVVVDADAGNNRRKIIAFVGGLDLCDGRYDTPQHPIFRTLQTVHKDDYHNPTYTVISYPVFLLVAEELLVAIWFSSTILVAWHNFPISISRSLSLCVPSKGRNGDSKQKLYVRIIYVIT